jgi:alpha-D-xyloside xylohydrolase
MAEPVPLLPYNLYMTEPPRLPVREPEDEDGPDYVVEATLLERGERHVRLQGRTLSGSPLLITLSLVADGIVRVVLEEEPDPTRVRLARELPPPPAGAPLLVEEQATGLALLSPSLRLEATLRPFGLRFLDAAGRPLLAQNYSELTNVRMKLTILPFGLSRVNGQRVAFHDTFTAEPDEHFFGLGEKFTDFDKRGQRITTWNCDCGGAFSERAYKNVPFVVSTRKYGIFVDSPCAVDFDLVASNTATFTLISRDSALDYYVIAGPDLKTIITRYASLVGFPILPPKWALGTWISSGFQRDSQGEVLARARLIREHEIPCDVLHLDCYWQRFGRWSEVQWDEERFPDPAGLIGQLKAQGFKVCLWIHPYLGTASERFAEGAARGYFLKNAAGEPYVADLWGGFHPPVAMLDVTHPEAVAWFQGLLREQLRLGVDVFKTDFGEGIPTDVVAYSGITGERLHNLYALLYNDAVAEVTARETGRAGLVWGRSSYAGGQRHAAQWSGDPNATFTALASTLRGGLSIGMCGHAFWSHDIGGFTGQPSPELYIRWAQFGFFSPLTRAHGNSSRLPWDFGPQALEIFRSYARLRYRLLPYIYTYACIAARTSLPLLRAMVLEFPDDPATYTLDLQYMFGAELLVAPLYRAGGERPVYLPAGTWVDFWSRTVLQGPTTLQVQAPLEQLPLYVRANALIPTTEPAPFVREEPFETVVFEAYLLPEGAGSFTLCDLDGETMVSARRLGTTLAIEVTGAKRRLGLHLLPLSGLDGQPPVETVLLNGRQCERWTGETAPALAQARTAGWFPLPDGGTQVTMVL